MIEEEALKQANRFLFTMTSLSFWRHYALLAPFQFQNPIHLQLKGNMHLVTKVDKTLDMHYALLVIRTKSSIVTSK